MPTFIFPREDSLSCVRMTSRNVSHPPHPQAVVQLLSQRPHYSVSHPGRGGLLRGAASLLSWSQGLLRKGFYFLFLALSHEKLPTPRLQLMFSEQITESHNASQPSPARHVQPKFCHKTKRRQLFELCAVRYIIFIFQILTNLRNLADSFYFLPFGRHMPHFMKCSAPVA